MNPRAHRLLAGIFWLSLPMIAWAMPLQSTVHAQTLEDAVPPMAVPVNAPSDAAEPGAEQTLLSSALAPLSAVPALPKGPTLPTGPALPAGPALSQTSVDALAASSLLPKAGATEAISETSTAISDVATTPGDPVVAPAAADTALAPETPRRAEGSAEGSAEGGTDVLGQQAQSAPVVSGFEFNPWQSAAIMGGMLIVLASAGVFLVRFKNKGLFPASRQERVMEVVGTLALAPKRSVLLVRIKGEEFAVASTEHGITFLKTIGEAAPHPSNLASHTVALARETLPARLSQGTKTSEASIANEAAALARGTGSKSDLLVSALRSMRGKPEGDRQEPVTAKVPPQRAPQKAPSSEASADAGLPKGGAFPRYLANAFAEEGKREIKKQRPETASPQNATDEHQVESVTSLIREKLREMKPLA